MAAWGVQQNCMPTKYVLSRFHLEKLRRVLVKSEKFVKVELTICDCNRLRQDIQITQKTKPFYKGLTIYLNDLLKEFPVPDNFGALWGTTWQLCCKK